MNDDTNKISLDIPKPGPGRPPGAQNKVTRALKEAILLAAEKAGATVSPGNLEEMGGTAAYLTWLACEEPKAFAGLLGRVLPMQMTGPDDGPVQLSGIAVRFVKAEKPEDMPADE